MKLVLACILGLAGSAYAQTESGFAHSLTVENDRCANATGMLFVTDLKELVGKSQKWKLSHDSTQGIVIELVCASLTAGGHPDDIAISALVVMRAKNVQPAVIVLHTLVSCDKRTAAPQAKALLAVIDQQFQ